MRASELEITDEVIKAFFEPLSVQERASFLELARKEPDQAKQWLHDKMTKDVRTMTVVICRLGKSISITGVSVKVEEIVSEIQKRYG